MSLRRADRAAGRPSPRTRRTGGWPAFFRAVDPTPHQERLKRHARGDFSEPEDDEQEQQ